MELDQISLYLSQVEIRDLDDEETLCEVRDSMTRLKAHAVAERNQALGKEIWCYETILTIQNHYLQAFQEMKQGKFYEAWCSLERVEIESRFLGRHLQISTENDSYRLAFIKRHSERFQSLFPYRIFLSPGFLYLEQRCSICHSLISLRNHCEHVVGEIYDGMMCCREITKLRLLEASLVANPVQKYSVPFFVDPHSDGQEDNYNYTPVDFVIRRLRKPFDSWDVVKTKRRHPHSMFQEVGENDPCPCDSGKKYKDCCLKEDGVLRPHLLVRFSVLPPKDLPMTEFS